MISSVPAPPYDRTSPFPELSRLFQVCYISRIPITHSDECVYFPIGYPEDDMKLAPVKTEEMFKVFGITDNEEQEYILNSFFGKMTGQVKKVLLWKKLSRHRPELFQILLSLSKITH